MLPPQVLFSGAAGDWEAPTPNVSSARPLVIPLNQDSHIGVAQAVLCHSGVN